MIRGKIPFRCTDCHKIFIDVDIEWQATALSMPVKCPKCGSKRTLPLWELKAVYKKIWETMDKDE